MSALAQDITELRIDASPPLLALPGPRIKRNPSLSKVAAWTADDVREAEKGNRTPLLEDAEEKTNKQRNHLQDYTLWEQTIICFRKYERKATNLLVKLLLHLSLISVFETIFFFMYVSTLEDSGIERTINTFITGATTACQNMTQLDIQLVNDFLAPLVNRTQVIQNGAISYLTRTQYNHSILNHAWIYTGILSGLLCLLWLYAKVRTLDVEWSTIVIENTTMVGLLAVYEIMFFNSIIYPYHPITSAEISRNAVETLYGSCGLFQAGVA